MMLYFLVLSTILCAMTSAFSRHPEFELRKARYCEKRLFGLMCIKWADSDLGEKLADAGVMKEDLKWIYYSLFSKPHPRNIRYIAIFGAGQQGLLGEDQFPDMMTGQIIGWRNEHGKTGEIVKTQFHAESYAVKFHDNPNNQFWPTEETLIISIPNHNFNHLHLKNIKEKYLEGYANYIDSLVRWRKIRGIYLGGYSRGGCFSMRLSQKLRSKFDLSHVKFIVQSVDGVCRWDQSEFGTSRHTIRNPLPNAPNGFKAFTTDVSGQFSVADRPNYCIRHLSGGEDIAKNLGLLSWVYTFSHNTSTAEYSYLETDDGFKWYQQQWSPYGHGTLRDDYSKKSEIIIPMENHFKFCKNHFW